MFDTRMHRRQSQLFAQECKQGSASPKTNLPNLSSLPSRWNAQLSPLVYAQLAMEFSPS